MRDRGETMTEEKYRESLGEMEEMKQRRESTMQKPGIGSGNASSMNAE